MPQIQTIKATDARNKFFELLKISYLQEKSFLVKKGGIPMVKIIPAGKRADEMESVKKKKISRKEYINKLLNMKTDWFTKEVEKDYQQIRHEFEEHFRSNSL